MVEKYMNNQMVELTNYVPATTAKKAALLCVAAYIRKRRN
ncbi:MAG: hypothetical protein RI947_1218 [Candidatus Parcubacteria bacterium]|jgi:hypothetical protein